MQRPHDQILRANAAFEALYPRLDSRVREVLDGREDSQQKQSLARAARLWTKLKIMWDELRLLSLDDRHQAFAQSIEQQIVKAGVLAQYESELEILGVSKSHTFIPEPTNLPERMEILSDMLAASLNTKLSKFKAFENGRDGPVDLINLKEMRDAEIQAYEEDNKQLMRLLSETSMTLHEEAEITLVDQLEYLEKVKHGRVEQFISAYIACHDAASLALLEKVERTWHDNIASIYTADMNRALEAHARAIRTALPSLEQRLAHVNQEIRLYEHAQTPEYIKAIGDFQRLKSEVAQAQQDVDRMSRYKTSSE